MKQPDGSGRIATGASLHEKNGNLLIRDAQSETFKNAPIHEGIHYRELWD
jgi:hypothetical protein